MVLNNKTASIQELFEENSNLKEQIMYAYTRIPAEKENQITQELLNQMKTLASYGRELRNNTGKSSFSVKSKAVLPLPVAEYKKQPAIIFKICVDNHFSLELSENYGPGDVQGIDMRMNETVYCSRWYEQFSSADKQMHLSNYMVPFLLVHGEELLKTMEDMIKEELLMVIESNRRELEVYKKIKEMEIEPEQEKE